MAALGTALKRYEKGAMILTSNLTFGSRDHTLPATWC